MKIYHYHPETGRFICEGAADPDPLEEGSWIIPAYATAEPPPTVAASQFATMTESGWTVYEPQPQEVENPPDEVKTAEQIKNEIVTETENRLERFASTRNYTVDSVAKYKDISDVEIDSLPETERPFVRKFRTECRYLALVVARTWAVLNIGLNEISAGKRPMPSSFADIEPMLPTLEWPIE